VSGSLADRVLALPPGKRKKWFAKLGQRAQQQIVMGLAWWFYGRPEQFAPSGSWRWWLICAGRGWGKREPGRNGSRGRPAATPVPG
jgi:phage terminase large subunit-like protein